MPNSNVLFNGFSLDNIFDDIALENSSIDSAENESVYDETILEDKCEYWIDMGASRVYVMENGSEIYV